MVLEPGRPIKIDNHLTGDQKVVSTSYPGRNVLQIPGEHHRLPKQGSTPNSGRDFCLGRLCSTLFDHQGLIVNLFSAWALRG